MSVQAVLANQLAEVRREARRVLESGEVKTVLGYRAGPTAVRAMPALITRPEDTDLLVWSPACANNLGLYVRQAAPEGKVAVVAKGCDARSIVMLIQEQQIPRESVYIIGVACPGVVDPDRLADAGIREEKLTGASWDGAEIVLESPEGEARPGRESIAKMACLTCDVHTPPLYDILIGEAPAIEPVDGLSPIPEGTEDRRAFWAKQFDRCVRCYACRQVCPSCYCTVCFADRASPRIVSKRIRGQENWMYHTVRAMHMAGRCVECGECERVCPVGIPLLQMMRELGAEVDELFAFKPGMDPEAEPVFGVFKNEDEGPEP